MNFHLVAAIVSTVLPILSPIVYIRSILKGISRPQRMTRFVLALVTTVNFVGLLAQKNYAVLGLAVVSMFQGYIILAFSIRRGIGGKSYLDFICLGVALLGIILWQVTSNPFLAVVAAVLADFVGAIPSLIKTYHLPHTEDWRFFIMDSVAGFFALLALTHISFTTAIYPFYILAINGLMVAIILGRGKVLSRPSTS